MQMTCGAQFSHLRVILVVLVTLSAHPQSVRADTPVSSSIEWDIATIRNRLVAHYVAGTFSGAGRYLASQSADGSWTDVNYADRSLKTAAPSGWDPQKHLDRLKEMAVGYSNAKSPHLHSIKMRDGILRGLAFWYNRKPAADNWWSNEIGQQLTLEPILILMADDLPPKLLQVGTTYLHDPVELASYKFTGQNLVWCATEQFIRGILRRSADDIASAVHVMESVDAVTAEAEGIQYDHSFHQHGPQLYVGGYGLNFLEDGTTNARLVAGTRFAYALRSGGPCASIEDEAM
jgi:hypothetical protein